MPSCLSGYFAVMLRQAALAVPVAHCIGSAVLL